jgi:type II secretory pathway pseudopilin PulG
MSRAFTKAGEAGFSLLEMMVAASVFIVLCGAAFGLLSVSQRSSQAQSQVLSSFQDARLGLDQIVRDVNMSGYPPQSQFSVLPTAADQYASTPIAWVPSYPGIPCSLGGNCTTPGDFDLIVETDPLGSGQVQWIRYQLQGTTLYRAMTAKVAGGDPDAATSAVLAPFVQNVMNSPSDPTQIAQFQAIYPAMYPGGQPVPIFKYTCDISDPLSAPGSTKLCSSAGADNSPANVRDVEITLIVMAPVPDPQTGQPRLVELNGRGHRVNPSQ